MTRPDRTRAEVIAVYLVRHGESAYNSEGRIQGQHDPPLTELGLRQAELVAGRLAEEKFDAVYSSDLVRARATAEVIAAGLGLSCETTPLLREARLGVIEGLTRAEVESKYQSSLHKWRVEPLA
ncbi:MAG: histidine phosphatase family protein, partial [Armatimonadota bacterium]